MNERGFSLVEALVALAVMSLVWASATGVLVALPAQTARWHDAADARQRLRVVDARGARLAANAGPIALRVGARVARVPSLWPRRLGLVRAGAVTDVSTTAVTFIARTSLQRVMTLDDALSASGGSVAVSPGPGCGSAAACGLASGDTVLVVSETSVCGLYRVVAAGARLTLEGLMPDGAGGFAAGAAIVAVMVTTMFLDEDSGELRLYDGYRSDNVLIDGVQGLTVALEAGAALPFETGEQGGPFVDEEGAWPGTGRLGDGPFVGSGPLAFDVDQILLRGVAMDLTLVAAPPAAPPAAAVTWRTRGWH